MNLFPSVPIFDITYPRSETVNHKEFLDATRKKKDEILLTMAMTHYNREKSKPFDHYFPNLQLKKLLQDKEVLDLGCWCGGKSVSLAERWKVKKMYGIDVNNHFIRAAMLFSSQRKGNSIQYDFQVGCGELIPYSDESFDAIVTWDVIEHVDAIMDTLLECKRVLKPGGIILAVFTHYLEPFAGAHLELVSKTPLIHWIFSPESILISHNEIINDRGEDSYWYYNPSLTVRIKCALDLI